MKPKEYKLKPKTLPLIRRVEKKIIKYLRNKAKAGAMYAANAELLAEIMRETRGSTQTPWLVPGQVYAFSGPVSIDGQIKNTVQLVDNFAAREVTVIKVVSRYKFETWKRTAEETDAKAAKEATNGEGTES